MNGRRRDIWDKTKARGLPLCEQSLQMWFRSAVWLKRTNVWTRYFLFACMQVRKNAAKTHFWHTDLLSN